MNEDRNRKKLEKSIRALPTYQPENTVWEYIQLHMDRNEQQEKLQQALQALPAYDPPKETWNNIKVGLEKENRIHLLTRWFRVGAAAAALIALMLAVPWLFSLKNVTRVQIIYSEESAAASLLSEWNEDEDAIAFLVSTVKSQPDFQITEYEDRLLQELNELTVAKTELQEAIDLYGVNDQLAREMAEIERARTDILEEMAAQI